MELLKQARQAFYSWLSLALITILVAILAVLQYRWIGEVSRAEQKTLEEKLQESLDSIRRDFNAEISSAASALVPSEAEVERERLTGAYERRYAAWRRSANHPMLFHRAGIAIPEPAGTVLMLLNPDTERFEPADWPEIWKPLEDWVRGRGAGQPSAPLSLDQTDLIDLPRFRAFPAPRGGPGRPPPAGRGDKGRGPGGAEEQNWLFLEVDSGYAAGTVLPELLARYLGPNYRSEFQVDVVGRTHPSETIYRSDANRAPLTGDAVEASLSIFEVGREPPGPSGRSPGAKGRGPEGGAPSFKGPAGPGRGRWLLLIRHQAGSLETVVEQTRRKNLAVSGIVLMCLLITAAVLVRFSRQAHRLAEAQMDFVAGVSHELRTPLAVIRTAAYNLRGKMSNNPAQVENYGVLIQEESEKLGAMVEQVLRFSSARAGQLLRENSPVQVATVIDESVEAARSVLDQHASRIETTMEPGLPNIAGDAMALRHALQNLIGNAAKYGAGRGGWIGVSARTVNPRTINHGRARAVEIRVSDLGPGIPPDEQKHIFEAFYRGKKAVADQIHGTGLGLSLVKKIVEAHGGTVALESAVGRGANFIVTIPVPAAPFADPDELAHSLG